MSDAAAPPASPLESLIAPAMAWDPSGRTWLPGLLAAAPRASEQLGRLAGEPGSISMTLSVRGHSGRLGCFAHPTASPRPLLAWYIDHPEALTRVEDDAAPAETRKLRSVLLDDDPPGSRARAQDRARELLPTASPYATAWWRFEDPSTPECVLMTDQLVITVQSDVSDPLAPATPWYPARTRLVRDLEAARQLAAGRAYASILIADRPALPPPELVRLVDAGAPHLDQRARRDLADAFLGSVTWDAAASALESR